MSRHRLFVFSLFFVALFGLGIPIEHKYDKLFRFFSLTLIPEGIQLPPWFEQKIYFYISDLLALLLTFVSLFLFRIPLSRFLFDKGSWCLWIVFFCAIVSITDSPLANYPIPYVRLLQLLTPILLYCYFSQNFSREENPKVATAFIITLFIAALFQSAIAIAQYFNQGPLGLRVLGEVTTDFFFRHFNTNRWTLDYLFPREEASSLLARASGTFPHGNVLAGFLCASLLASYSLIATSKHKILFSLGFLIQFFAMSVTFSRAALLAWGLGSCVWLGLHIYHLGFLKTLKDRAVRLIALLIFLALGTTTALLYEQIFSRGGVFNYNHVAKGSDNVRLYYQDIALRMIKAKPLTGVGFSQMTLRTPEHLASHEDPAKSLSGTHNIYLFLAAETGLISLGAFLLFILLLLNAAFKAPFTQQHSSLVAIFFAFLFIGMCDFYPILFQQGKLLFFGFAGLLAAQSYFPKPFSLRKNEYPLSQ